MKRIAIYVRVSTTSQNEAGQRAEINRWLEGHVIDPGEVQWYVDKESGDTMDRPAFERLQAAVFRGEVGTVLVYKLDRVSRKLRDGIDTLCDWTDRGVRVVAVTQQIDLSGTVGKMIAAVLLGVAEMEQETRRERQRAGIDAVKSDPATRSKKYRGRKPGTFKAKPRRARELRAKGYEYREIANALGVSLRTAHRYCKDVPDDRVDSTVRVEERELNSIYS